MTLSRSLAIAFALSIMTIFIAGDAVGQPVGAQEPTRSLGATIADLDEGVKTLSTDGFGKPPADLAKLITRGQVRFTTGGQPKRDASLNTSGRRLAGQTEFHFEFRYRCRARWQMESRRATSTSETMVRLRVRFQSLALKQTHVVWLRDPPADATFWNHPVVRHEFDHVRISADERIEDYFLDQIKSLETVRVPLSQLNQTTGRVDQTSVNEWIDARMQSILQNTTEYVRIRYRELDRLTEHGMRPLPAASADFFSESPAAVADRE